MAKLFTIPAGKHRAKPLGFGIWRNRTKFVWKVCFDESCRYQLSGADQYDYNKLCGVGFFPWHHVDSARFGWRYNHFKGNVELAAYCYVDGIRIVKEICDIEIGRNYYLELFCLHGSYCFTSSEIGAGRPPVEVDIVHAHNKKFKYRLGLFFGGNKPAPHKITVKIDKA